MKKDRLSIKQTEKINHNISYLNRIKDIQTFGYGLEVHLTEHCNLNCKGCSHFSPLAEKEFMKVEVFEKDMARMAQLFDEYDIRIIRLLGGEPLLHPQVNEFIEISFNIFSNIHRVLVTNGLLLMNMPESFWKTCRETHTSIHLSRYPVPLDFDAIERYVFAKGVKLVIYPEKRAKKFRKEIYDLNGSQDESLSHWDCGLFGYCCQLNNGRFYPCSISAYFHHFNRFFNLGIPLSAQNYIDIYNAKSKKDFFQLITSPIPCCSYCNMGAKTFNVKWEYSKKQINEWT